MFLISHRGNIEGKTELENHPDYINKALELGFDVEIDVWVVDNDILLGHDFPQYKIEISFLKNEKLWCHAKNYDALNLMLENDIHCFWHQEDTFTITSKGYIWQYPSITKYNNAIFLMPENFGEINISGVKGICSDYIKIYKNI